MGKIMVELSPRAVEMVLEILTDKVKHLEYLLALKTDTETAGEDEDFDIE
jgi:hypothetical protein